MTEQPRGDCCGFIVSLKEISVVIRCVDNNNCNEQFRRKKQTNKGRSSNGDKQTMQTIYIHNCNLTGKVIQYLFLKVFMCRVRFILREVIHEIVIER